MFLEHYLNAALTGLLCRYFCTSLITFMFFFHFSTTSVSFQLLLSRSQYFTPAIMLHELDCLYICGYALSVLFLFQEITMQFLAHRAICPSLCPDFSSVRSLHLKIMVCL